jgi:tetratricopeptide (TPR) repeat protein
MKDSMNARSTEVFKNTTKPMPPDAPKSSSADYPVDPVERAAQQQRLKKAAAAGADTLKAPMPSAMFRLPSSSAAPVQNLPEPRTHPAHSAPKAANPETAEISPIAPEQNIEMPTASNSDEILMELRKISAWADAQRKISRWTFIGLAIFLPVLIGGGVFIEQRMQSTLEVPSSARKPDWFDMDQNARLGEFDKAIGIGEDLIARTPQSPEAHQRLAGVYLASGNLEKAREHYAEAFRLFPSEENEKRLGAIDARMRSEKP